MKVAILHYWFLTRRGGEKVVESILKIFPNADIYTIFYDEKKYGNYISNHKIYTSKLNNKFFRKHYQKLFPLYPFAVKSLKLKQKYDLIISSESGPIKGVQMPKSTPHICYIHTPMRYCWSFKDEYLKTIPIPLRPIVSYFFEKLRKWDETTVDNVTVFVANSKNVADRVKRFYNRESEVIHPPISLDFFRKHFVRSKEPEFYLSFGAITPYKKIDLLVDLFNRNEKKLIIIGDGSEKEKLEKIAKSNITFLGSLKWNEIEEILRNTKALLFPGEEDFGMIPLEVMAHGIPVLAYNKGGALETVVENKIFVNKSSGIFFKEQTIESLSSCIESFEKVKNQFDKDWIINHARKFGEDYFLMEFKYFLDSFKKNKGLNN